MDHRIAEVRASAVPRLLYCPESVRGGDDTVDFWNEPRQIGAAVHEGIAAWIRDGESIPAELLADKHGTPDSADEIGRLMNIARSMWGQLKAKFPAPVVEQEMSMDIAGLHITAHPDVYSIGGKTAKVLDWKSGRKRMSYWGQLNTYALIVAHTLSVDRVQVTTAWLQDNDTDTVTLDAEALKYHARMVTDAMGRKGFEMGPHCADCPRFYSCDAAKMLCDRAAELAGASIEKGTLAHDGINTDKILGGLKGSSKTEGRYRDLVKARILRDGPILTNTGEVDLKECKRQKLVNPKEAWPILREYGLTQDQFQSVFERGLTAAKEAVKANTAKGNKGAAVVEMLEKLDSAGCIKYTFYSQLVGV